MEDFKKPTSWKDVSIAQFVRLRSIPETMSLREKGLQAVAILLGTRVESVRRMEAMEYLKVNRDLEFASLIPASEFEPSIEIDGTEYGFIPDISALSIAEMIDLETYSMNWDRDLAKLMAILYRPLKARNQDGTYTIEDYGDSRSDVRAKLFEDRMSAQDAYGASLFFSLIVATCLTSSQRSSERLTMATQMLTMT